MIGSDRPLQIGERVVSKRRNFNKKGTVVSTPERPSLFTVFATAPGVWVTWDGKSVSTWSLVSNLRRLAPLECLAEALDIPTD